MDDSLEFMNEQGEGREAKQTLCQCFDSDKGDDCNRPGYMYRYIPNPQHTLNLCSKHAKNYSNYERST